MRYLLKPTKFAGVLIILLVISSGIIAQDFTAIDAHAKTTPRTAEKNIEALAAYLNDKTSTNLEKVRAYYIWLTHNINYDTKTFFSNNPNPKTSANDALKYKRAICQGYSELFKALCDYSNIPCFIISGYSKGYGYSPNKNFTNSDHAWNAVFINSKWYLIDATWGAGYIDTKRKYVKEFTADYFLQKPEIFILKHLPSDPMWQLIACPISIKDYKKSDDKITQILQNCNGSFNYNDTIAAYLKLPAVQQQLKSAERAFRFNPENVEAPGYALLSVSYEMGAELNGYYNNEEYDKALKLNKEILEINEKALGFLRKSKTQHSKSAVGICKQNIKSSKENIQSLEGFMKQ